MSTPINFKFILNSNMFEIEKDEITTFTAEYYNNEYLVSWYENDTLKTVVYSRLNVHEALDEKYWIVTEEF